MHIVLSGYYGFDNAGDEALLKAIVESLSREAPGARFTVLSGNPARTREMHGLRAVSRVNPAVLIRELADADLLISGGGSLLQDVSGPLSIPYYLGIVALARMLRTPVVFYAQGIGPVRTRLGKTLIRLIVPRVSLITLRDQDSARLLETLGVKGMRVQVTADPVFSLRPQPDEVERGARLLRDMGINGDTRRTIGVSLRSWEGFEELSLARMLDFLAERGWTILFMPLQYREDLQYSLNIRNLMKNNALVLDHPLSSTEMMGLVGHLGTVVGMRLHSLIFAACMGTPFEGIAYDPKVSHFLKLFKQEPLINPGSFDPERAALKIEETCLNYDLLSPRLQQVAAGLKEKADITSRLALSVLPDRDQGRK